MEIVHHFLFSYESHPINLVSIDPATGLITPELSSLATYTILFTGDEECTGTSSFTLSITDLDEDANFKYPETSYCKNDMSIITPIISNVDLAGIWASGNIYRGCSNSLGLFHWFETDTFSLDFSLVTKSERMVKGTFAGNEWNQKNYESYMNKSIEKLELLKRDSVKIDPGDYRTYIAPAGVSDILDMFSWNCIGEASIRQGQSALIKLRENKKLSNCFLPNKSLITLFLWLKY